MAFPDTKTSRSFRLPFWWNRENDTRTMLGTKRFQLFPQDLVVHPSIASVNH